VAATPDPRKKEMPAIRYLLVALLLVSSSSR